MTKANVITVTYQQFAEGVGRTDRMTLEASLAWHKEYVKLDAEKQSEWKYDFVLNYVIGRMDCSRKQAEIICNKTRTERTANQEKAVNSGSKRFAEHISRTTSRSGKKVDVKFTREQVQACDNALASFKADKLSEQIKMLRAYLTSLEAK
jgi:hypothetical protein